MADKVQFILDRMAPTFRDMEVLGIFEKHEVRSIVQRRTDFEYLLRRRQQSCADYNKYLLYELNLDDLLKVRCTQAAKSATKEKKEQIRKLQTATVRHICYVYERSLRRYAGNMDLWNDYIYFLKKKGANAILNTVFGRALSLHPKKEDLWIQAAIFEVEVNANVHASRVLLQRALRINRASGKLWVRYFQLELWASVRSIERSRILGIEDSPSMDSNLTKVLNPSLSVPLVVYRHAVTAIPSLEFANELLAACPASSVVEALRHLIEVDVQQRYGHDCTYWVMKAKRLMKHFVEDVDKTHGMRSLTAFCRGVESFVTLCTESCWSTWSSSNRLEYLSILQPLLDTVAEKIMEFSSTMEVYPPELATTLGKTVLYIQEVSGMHSLDDAIAGGLYCGGHMTMLAHRLWKLRCGLAGPSIDLGSILKCDIDDVCRWLESHRSLLDQNEVTEVRVWIDVATMAWTSARHLEAYSEQPRDVSDCATYCSQMGSLECVEQLKDVILGEYRFLLKFDACASDGSDSKGTELLWITLQRLGLQPAIQSVVNGSGNVALAVANRREALKTFFESILGVSICRDQDRVEWSIRYSRFSAEDSYGTFRNACDFIANLQVRMPMVFAKVDMTPYFVEVLLIAMSWVRGNSSIFNGTHIEFEWTQNTISNMINYCSGRETATALAVDCREAETEMNMLREALV